MTCPDEARLDLWLDDALASEEAAAVAAHLAACAPCGAQRAARLGEERLWRAALALDAVELAYLARADLGASWRTGLAPTYFRAPVGAPDAGWGSWPALVLLALVGTYLAWQAAVPTLEAAAGLANRAGLVGLGLSWVLGQFMSAAAAAGAAAAHPVFLDPTRFVAAASVLLWVLVARPWARSATA